MQPGDVVFLSLKVTKCSSVDPSTLSVDPLYGTPGVLDADLQVGDTAQQQQLCMLQAINHDDSACAVTTVELETLSGLRLHWMLSWSSSMAVVLVWVRFFKKA